MTGAHAAGGASYSCCFPPQLSLLLLLLLLLSARAQRGSDSGSHSTRLPGFELRKLKICTSTKLKLLLQHRHPSSSFSFFRSCNWDLVNSNPGNGYPTDNSIRLVEIRNCTLGKYVAQKLVSPKYFLLKFVTQEFGPPFFPGKEMVNIFARKETVNQVVGSKHCLPVSEVVTLSVAVTKWEPVG